MRVAEMIQPASAVGAGETVSRAGRMWKGFLRCFQERRSSERQTVAIASEIRWKDEYGGIHFVRGMCVDKSRGGAGVVCNEPFASGTYLSLKFESGTTECVVVCHCQQMGAAYLLGLKFAVQGDR